MNENNFSRPAILVDLKKYRIRIHKNTLHAIGSPDNILLLVNPEEHTLAVLHSNHKDPRSHYISEAYLKKKKCIELYSRSLVKSLREVCSDWQDNESYRMYGEIIPNEGVAQFHMSESVLLKRSSIIIPC